VSIKLVDLIVRDFLGFLYFRLYLFLDHVNYLYLLYFVILVPHTSYRRVLPPTFIIQDSQNLAFFKEMYDERGVAGYNLYEYVGP
jgi:hypothetical protein